MGSLSRGVVDLDGVGLTALPLGCFAAFGPSVFVGGLTGLFGLAGVVLLLGGGALLFGGGALPLAGWFGPFLALVAVVLLLLLVVVAFPFVGAVGLFLLGLLLVLLLVVFWVCQRFMVAAVVVDDAV